MGTFTSQDIFTQYDVAKNHLSSHGITMQEARDYIIGNLDNLNSLFNTLKMFGVTNSMVAEIYGGVSVNDVKNFFSYYGLNASELDNNTSSTLPTSFTTSDGTVLNIVAGTSGDDVFTHSSGDIIYLGGGGNDTFNNTYNSQGNVVFVGGQGNDTYNIQPGEEVYIKDVGGGYDTYNAYTINSPGYNFLIDNKFVGTAFTNPSNTLVVSGDLSNPMDNIEFINLPGITSSSVNISQAISYLSQQSNWLGNLSSADIFKSPEAFYYANTEIIGINSAYIDAGVF